MIRVGWFAHDARGIAHAQEQGATRVACRAVRVIEPRFAWPTTSRCEDCLEIVRARVNDETTAAARPRRTA